MVTSSLMKDMTSRTDVYRANAIRVLCQITDGTLLAQIERYLKQAIVDKNPVVASAALVSGIHILQVLADFVLLLIILIYVMFCTYTPTRVHVFTFLLQEECPISNYFVSIDKPRDCEKVE